MEIINQFYKNELDSTTFFNKISDHVLRPGGIHIYREGVF